MDVVRICDRHKPKVIFCENVKNLVDHDKGHTFQVIREAFETIGYKVFYKVLNSKDASETDLKLAEARLHRALVRKSVASYK